jgi:hypothetical protein
MLLLINEYNPSSRWEDNEKYTLVTCDLVLWERIYSKQTGKANVIQIQTKTRKTHHPQKGRIFEYAIKKGRSISRRPLDKYSCASLNSSVS